MAYVYIGIIIVFLVGIVLVAFAMDKEDVKEK
jgi:hypothetical protein